MVDECRFARKPWWKKSEAKAGIKAKNFPALSNPIWEIFHCRKRACTVNQQQLIHRIRIHNFAHIVWGILLLALAILLWFVSFAAISWFFDYILTFAGLRAKEWPVLMLTSILLGLLAIEGFRGVYPLFSAEGFEESGASDYSRKNAFTGFGFQGEMHGIHNPAPTAFILLNFFLCAPRCTSAAFYTFRKRIHYSEEEAAAAVSILEELRQRKKWIAAKAFNAPRSVILLSRLHLIWQDDKSGQLEIRFPIGD